MVRTFQECLGFLQYTDKDWEIHYDVDYGMNEKSGYSIFYCGAAIVEFEPVLLDALNKVCNKLEWAKENSTIQMVVHDRYWQSTTVAPAFFSMPIEGSE